MQTETPTRRQLQLNRDIPTAFYRLEEYKAGDTHFFSPSSRRFFKSRNVGDPIRHPKTGAVYFIDSTKSGFDDPTRTYNVHVAQYVKHRGRFSFSVSSPLSKHHSARSAAAEIASLVA